MPSARFFCFFAQIAAVTFRKHTITPTPNSMSRHIIPLLFVLITLASPAFVSAQEGPAAVDQPNHALQHLSEMSRISPPQQQALDEMWRGCPNVGLYVVSEHIAKLAADYQQLLKAEGPEAVANRVMDNFSGTAANDHMSAVAIALRGEAGLTRGGALPREVKVTVAKKENPESIIEPATAIFEGIRGSGAPQAKLAAVEYLAHLQSEGLVCLHNMSGNGGYRTPGIPHELTALAADYLDDPDPFIRALADWSISIAVCNENDRERGEAWPPKDGEAPEWFQAYMAQPASTHLPYDYVRQLVSLGMHRTPADALVVAKDVSRRALERAAWARQNGGNTAQIQQAMDEVGSALQTLEDSAGESAATFHEKYLEWRRTVRDVVLQGPDIDFDSLVYIKRFNASTHLQPSVHSAAQFPDGGDIFVQTGLNPDAALRPLGLQEKIGKGFGHDLDLWWDADRIVFSWKTGSLQKLFEIGLDGENLTQITDGPFSDVDPAYLPDGEVVFGSTRGEVGIMCATSLGALNENGSTGVWNGLHTNIYRTWDERSRVERLSYCKDDDAYPHVLNDGRIVYMRWDYQERGVNEIFSLWVMHPDGTGADGFHKVHIPEHVTIQALRDTRPVEDSSLMVSAGGGHYNYAEGSIILGDPREGINNPDSLKNVTPYAGPVLYGWGEMEPVVEGGVPYVGGYYCKPLALSEKSFLVSATYDQPQSNNFQVYYIDVWGNKELIQRDKLFETVSVAPIKPRKRPMVLANKTNDELTHATLYLDDMYADLPGVEKGEIKYLRILQMVHWIRDAGKNSIQWHPVSNAGERFGFGTGGPVRTVGIVPVNDDGSAFFEVPADIDLYFQALDENFMAIQRMRTHVEFQPGEMRSCIGCHETKTDAVQGYRMGQSLAEMKPVRPTPPPWGDTTFLDYEKHIQPIFDAKCVECHAGKADQGWLDLTARRDEFGFMQGYRAVYGLKPSDETPFVQWTVTGEKPKDKKVPRSHDHPWWDITFDGVLVRQSSKNPGGAVTQPREYGAVTHPFAKKLVEDPEHRKRLTDTELQTLMNWFDVQIPYFATARERAGGNGLIQVKIDPYPPFGESRSHTIHHGQDVTPQL